MAGIPDGDPPRLGYGVFTKVGPGWHRLVVLDGTVTFAVEVVQGRPKEGDYGMWGHEWRATVLDCVGVAVFRCRVKKSASVRAILERAGLMGPELRQGREIGRGAVVVASQDEPTSFAVLDPSSGRSCLVTTSEGFANQEASLLDWARLAERAEA